MNTDAYFTNDHKIFWNGKDGPCQLTNFDAWIQKQLVYHDAHKTTTILEIAGRMPDDPDNQPVILPPIRVPATEFAGMGWVSDQWGMGPVIFPHPSAERNLRTAIQLKSKPEVSHIYTHVGWTTIAGRRTYLTSTGGVHAKGLDADLTVQLPNELANYALPAPEKSRDNFAASITLANIGPKRVLVPLLLATYRAAIGPADFAMHLAGRTGTFKSEVTSLMQSHYGEQMDARHLPASWSATANALEHLAYRAANAILVCDDFVPVGTAYHVRTLQKTADQIIRAQGNQAGRARLTDASALQTTYYPRGIIVSTGEDVPEGHSIRGRMLIVELSPGDIDTKALSKAQAQRPRLAAAMSDWVRWNAEKDRFPALQALMRRYRDQNLAVGHSRTPSIVGDLIATADLLGQYAVERKYLTLKQATQMLDNATEHVLEAAKLQTTYLESSDPVNALAETIRGAFSAQTAHLKTKSGGVPENATRYGWLEQTTPGEMPTYKSSGPRIGWLDLDKGEILLDPASLTLLKKYGGGRMTVTPQTLMKRVKEAGLLSRADTQNNRNTVRVTCEGHSRYVLALNHDLIMEEVQV